MHPSVLVRTGSRHRTPGIQCHVGNLHPAEFSIQGCCYSRTPDPFFWEQSFIYTNALALRLVPSQPSGVRRRHAWCGCDLRALGVFDHVQPYAWTLPGYLTAIEDLLGQVFPAPHPDDVDHSVGGGDAFRRIRREHSSRPSGCYVSENMDELNVAMRKTAKEHRDVVVDDWASEAHANLDWFLAGDDVTSREPKL